VPHLTDSEISRLARGWRDNSFLAGARDHALSPDSPLIIDLLAAFDRIDAVFFGELDDGGLDGADAAGADLDEVELDSGSPTHGTTLKPQLINTALKAIRDGLAAAYARPILGRAEYIALIGPWRRALPLVDPAAKLLPPRTPTGD
jgi:hypothetical protein